MDIDEVRTGYDLVAAEYRARLGDELTNKPFDRQWLDGFIARLPERAFIVEAGCGDGHVANYIARSSNRVEGLDLSPNMIAIAQNDYPELRFRVGNMLDLPYDDHSVHAIVAFYSIVNLAPEDCDLAFHEFARVLAPEGRATIAFHVGDEKRRVESWWETSASLDFYFHPVERIVIQLAKAGLTVAASKQRAPYSESVETQTQRAYLIAERRSDT